MLLIRHRVPEAGLLVSPNEADTIVIWTRDVDLSNASVGSCPTQFKIKWPHLGKIQLSGDNHFFPKVCFNEYREGYASKVGNVATTWP